MTEPDLPDDPAVAALMRARRFVIEDDWLTVEHATRMVGLGWTPGFYRWIDDAIEALATAGPEAPFLAETVLAAELTAGDGGTQAEVLPWLAVLIACPDGVAAIGLQERLEGEWSRWAARWHSLAPQAAALAWAAGLEAFEARARATAGTLDEGKLRTLAALRGFPPLNFAALP